MKVTVRCFASVRELLGQDELIVEVAAGTTVAALKEQLGELRLRCQHEQSMDACGILKGLASMEPEFRQEKHTHLG